VLGVANGKLRYGDFVLTGFYDGKDSLLCSVHQLYECDPPNGCTAVSPGEIRGVSHLEIDFGKKLITRAGVDSPQKSPIRR
jgi:hypothetical protein